MTNMLKAGSLLVAKATDLAYLVEETVIFTKTSSFISLRAVGTLQMKLLKVDLSRFSEDYTVVEPEEG